MSDNKKTNALIQETSPYLLQHANNPVDWHPWNETALALAQRENKPILLSIGYSACHWCHVMAHESFENEAIAKLMNEHFINIKVDREERPDIDKIYQTAQHMLTQRSGGWPLTMFLRPDDHMPFFGGTYFPPTERHGLPGFRDVLLNISHFYENEQVAIDRQSDSLRQAFETMQAVQPGDGNVETGTGPLFNSVQELTHIFDNENGGFGGAPKFPGPSNCERLLHHHEMFSNDGKGLSMALHTLRKMARGGIYDQLGGGFCRYSVDHLWLIPHFEKMLYDNGPLLALYSHAWRISGDPLFRKIAIETADWIIREMQAPEAGYYSSLDADSEGEEGKFYVWVPEQVKSVLTEDEYGLIAPCLGLDQPANFEGVWHLYNPRPLQEVAAELGLVVEQAEISFDAARHKLYQIRSERVWPGRDEKILTSWNALAIRGMSIAALQFDRQDYLDSAENALRFIHGQLWRDGRLLATCKGGKAHLNAYLDDYAFLLDACLHVLQAQWSSRWLRFAMELADCLLDLFYDKEEGGFYFTSHDHEKLIQRRKDFTDDAIPSGNGIASSALIRLGHLVSETRYLEAAECSLRCAWPGLEMMPSAHQTMLFALEDSCSPPLQIILRGDKNTIKEWKRAILDYLPLRSQIFAIAEDETGLPEILEQRKTPAIAAAFVCEGFKCLEPMTGLNDLGDYLKNIRMQ